MDLDAIAPQLRVALDGKMNWSELHLSWNWRDTRVVPFYAVLLSMTFLLRHLSLRQRDSTVAKTLQDCKKQFAIARVLSCVLLAGLSVVRAWNTTWGEWGVCTMAVTYLYAVLIALMSVLPRRSSVILTRHLTLLMLLTLAVYIYRDIWQLATYDQKPLDISEGWFVVVEICLVALIAVLLPLFAPRQYVPIDPTDPDNTPSPEQTASLASLLFYTYLDPIIVKANKLSHLPYTELPTLADYDHAKNIAKHVDPIINEKRHVFFGLLHVFRYDFCMVAVVLIIHTCSTFAAPIGINRVLAYLETGSSNNTTGVRPWFWVLWLFLGPTISFLTFQLEIYLTSWMLVRMESLVTQLLFEHSLRMRVKAEVDENGKATGNLTGRLNNLITSDLSNIRRGWNILDFVLATPLKLTLCLVFLYRVLGWSAFAGLASIIVLFPVPGLIAARIEGVQVKGMNVTDERVQTMTESINVLRMIKLFGWESITNKKIDEKRIEELKWIRKRKVLEMGSTVSNFVMLSITTLVTYGTFTVIMKQELSASIVFSSASVFNALRLRLGYLFQNTSMMVQAKVSLDRLNDFLHMTELLDSHSEKEEGHDFVTPTNDMQDTIGFKSAFFAWAAEGEGSQMSRNRLFKLQIDGEVLFKRNCINLIVGPTGSGKTAILMALLGEMHFIPSNSSAWYNLPCKGGIAYAAQESWVQNDTIRENILFGSPFDEMRYKKVLYQCALEPDLELFEAGDQTEVGERGLTLSGGQKARVTLARAVYSSAEIILLDDVLAALDAHTSKWIVEKCFLGDLVKGRTVLLVTHNIMLASPLADFVVAVDMDGNVTCQGSGIAAALSHDEVLASEVQAEQDKLVKKEEDIDSTAQEPTSGKLVIAEEINQGRVSRSTYNLFLSALSGKHPVVFLVMWIAGIIVTEGITNFQIWYLGYWGSQYETHPSSEISATYYMTVYSLLLIIMSIVYSIKTVYYMLATVRASRSIHERLVKSVLGSTFRWLDETPTSRVIARCTQDIQAVDGAVPDTFSNVVEGAIMVMYQLGGSVIFAPIFIFPGIGVAALGLYIASIFLKAQLSIKREMSNAKSPVLSHFSATIAGLVSIRAFGVQDSYRHKSHQKLDHYARIARTSYNITRWISIRMQVFGVLLTGGLAAYLVYGRSTNPANAGFSLTMAVDLCPMLLWWVQVLNIFEVQSNSLERIKSYLEIDQEQGPQQQNVPPAAWPSSGKLVVDRLYARYSPTGPLVLHDISFEVKPGERIGVVGRTGSGKSSLTLSLLRCIPTEGHIYYDDLPTMDMNLDTLRSNITIIPQMPELLSGTIRRNLDPFEQYDDLTLINALRSAGLTTLQDEAGEGRITLDSNISAAGSNLSVGQRQIIALARAIVRGSKLLILDEATSAIDQKTDAVIQTTLRNELSSDVSVLIVAHRLQTIMDADKIMVLDDGRIVEFDSPKFLLSKEEGMLKLLVDSSIDKDVLYAMAMGHGN